MTTSNPGDTSSKSTDSASIDALCDQFEAAWHRGEQPKAEEHMRQSLDGESADDLLRELLLLEMDYRHRHGNDIAEDELAERFPARQEVARKLLAEWQATQSLNSPAKTSGEGGRPAASSPSAAKTTQLGDYELLEELGRGGMGVVYRARQRETARIVALKVIRAGQFTPQSPEKRDESVARFRTESLAAARLEHDHIVTVYQVGEAEGVYFYSMRFVEGGSLRDLLLDSPLPNHRAARYTFQAARAMEAAHAAGVIHRDLKPHNLMIDSRSDRAMVTDFGLAKLTDTVQGWTVSGAVFGTPPYMSPEQAEDASKVSAATDIYGLGATLYHTITGRPPFQAATITETLREVIDREPVAPRRLNPAVDRDLEKICLKCLEKNSGRRYDSAGALADDLQRYLSGETITARPVGLPERLWRWCRRKPWVATTAAIAVASIVLVAVVSTIGFVVTGAALQRERSALQSASDAQAAEAEQRRIAEQRAEKAQRLASRLLINEAQHLTRDRKPGWTWRGLDNLRRSLALAPPKQTGRVRTIAATCLGEVDLRRTDEIAPGYRCLPLAVSHDGTRLAAAQFKASAYSLGRR